MEVVVDATSTNNINYQYCCKTLLALQQGCKQVFVLSILLALFMAYFIYLVKKPSCKDALGSGETLTKSKMGNSRTLTVLPLCLFQTAIAANLFLVLGLRRNFPQFQGAYAHILLVILNTSAMIGFLECLHGFGHMKLVLPSFGGMFYVIMCVLHGPNGENTSFKGISAILFLFLFIPAIADFYKVRMSKAFIIPMMVFETVLGMMLVA